jgi:hypothetical protein
MPFGRMAPPGAVLTVLTVNPPGLDDLGAL